MITVPIINKYLVLRIGRLMLGDPEGVKRHLVQGRFIVISITIPLSRSHHEGAGREFRSRCGRSPFGAQMGLT